MRRRVRLVASAACGIIAVMLAGAHADAARAQAREERAEVLERYGGEVTTLVVARRELARGDVVAEADVEEREWLSDLAPAGSIGSLDDVVGVRLTSPVASGAPITGLDFAKEEGSLDVPEGRVALSVRLGDRSGVAQDTAPGSRVLAYAATADGVRLISDDVQVLGMGSSASRVSDQAVTLAVLPADVTAVLGAGSDGTLRLAVPAHDVEARGGSVASAPTSVPALTTGEESAEAPVETTGVGTEATADSEASAEASASETGVADEPDEAGEAESDTGDEEAGGEL